VFIIEYYFARKSFADIREAFSNAYPDKDVTNMTTIQLLVPKCRDKKCLSVTSAHEATAEIMAVPISSRASVVITEFGCKNSIPPLVSSFCG
jgi:hypothetical protein